MHIDLWVPVDDNLKWTRVTRLVEFGWGKQQLDGIMHETSTEKALAEREVGCKPCKHGKLKIIFADVQEARCKPG